MKKYPVIIRLSGEKQFHSIWDIMRSNGQAVGTVCLRKKHIQVERVSKGVWKEVALGENNV